MTSAGCARRAHKTGKIIVLILTPNSRISQVFAELIASADMVFVAGLPGVGKSLMLQQLTLMAQQAGREVDLLQWDTVRVVFERPIYPVIAGVTHPMVIRATNLWLRGALVEWQRASAERADARPMLVGELPIVGDRFMAVVRKLDDCAESILSRPGAQFIIPTPTVEMRAIMEASRERTFAEPRHWNEVNDCPPDVMRDLWQEWVDIARRLKLADTPAGEVAFSPEIYLAVFRYLLRHRHFRALPIEEILEVQHSVYAFEEPPRQVQPSQAESDRILASLASAVDLDTIIAESAAWYKV